MKENLYVNSNTRIIARNNYKFLATNDKNVTVNDISSSAFIIDQNGNIVDDNVSIGSIIKFGYWNVEDTTFGSLSHRLFVENNIKNAFFGMAVSEMLEIINNIFCSDQSLKLDSETLELVLSKYDFDISGFNINLLISIVNGDEASSSNLEFIMNRFIKNLYQFQKYGDQYENAIKIVNRYVDVASSNIKDLQNILFFGLDYLFNDEVENQNRFFELRDISEIDKIGIIVCIDFLKNFLETNDKDLAFKNLALDNYHGVFSKNGIDYFKQLIEFDFQNINMIFEKEEFTYVQRLIVIFYSILKTDSYLESILMLQKFKNVNILDINIAGFIAGIIYQESGIPEDMLINLDVEEDIKRVASNISIKICNDKLINC